MTRQTYLLRKSGRYHFRRRFAFAGTSGEPISIALGTADPRLARNLARRLAVRWDEMRFEMEFMADRKTLTLAEQQSIMRKALEAELCDATRAAPGSTVPIVASDTQRKALIAAYKIAGSVSNIEPLSTRAQVETVIDESWTPEEVELLRKTLKFYVTPMSVSKTKVDEELRSLDIPVNEQTCAEARWMMFRGKIEAQERLSLLRHAQFQGCIVPGLELLDDEKVRQARHVKLASRPQECQLPPIANAPVASVPIREHPLYAETSTIRFSEQIDELHALLFEKNGWQPDGGKTRLMLESFAWLTGDKIMSDYRPADIDLYIKRLTRIPKGFKWGELNKSGGMAVPYDQTAFPSDVEDIPPEQVRLPRTINSYLSKIRSASELLKKTHWLPKSGSGKIMCFDGAFLTIEADPADPRRVPWTPEHLKAMYSLPLWQGGGGEHKRLAPSDKPRIYWDAAYWVPLIGTYTGLSREEACGLECVDIAFEYSIPFLIVQKNMTKSKDGKKPAGLKRSSRYRLMPLHPELLRLGFAEYVAAVEAAGSPMLFPELYEDAAKHSSEGKKVPQKGGRRFYAIAWRFIMDATHARMPLPETRDGKKADFHSQRTYNNSILAAPGVGETLIADHMGHARKGTGPKHYNRRGLTVGQEKELSERLDVLVREMPIVTDHVACADGELLPLQERSRVGSAPGRNAANRFCADPT